MKNLYTPVFMLLLLLCHLLIARGRDNTRAFTWNTNLSFIANAGQITDQYNNLRKDIDYKLNAPGLDIFIGDGQIHYQWTRTNTNKNMSPLCLSRRGAGGEVLDSAKKAEGQSTIEIYRLDVSLIGANKNAQVIAEEKQDYYERYYLAHTGVDGVTAHCYQKITYQNVYPNIDWVLYVRGNQLKYDFVVHPGGDPKAIKLKYEGADELSLKDGALTATTPFGSITEQKPYSYCREDHQNVSVQFLLTDNILSFETGRYAGTVVIDPLLVWATYYGSFSNDLGYGVATDGGGNVYMIGYTNVSTNLATAGAYQTSFLTSGVNGIMVKFNSLGQRLWATYFSGSGSVEMNDVLCDGVGNIYFTGRTGSVDHIATPGSYQSVLGGATDAFLEKFNGAGQRLWGTYYGGSMHDAGNKLAMDNSGNIYMSGFTESTNGIATAASHQGSYGGGITDAFLVKFSSGGLLQWGTYYGGVSDDNSTGLKCDGAGNVYMCGFTQSSNGVATLGSQQPVIGGSVDGYIVKFSGTGVRQWGTYFGGPGIENTYNFSSSDQSVRGLAMDGANIYFTGVTTSMTGISTPGSYQPNFGGGTDDIFLAKFNLGGVLQWSTYYGGPGSDKNATIDFSTSGYIYLGGTTNSSTGIATAGNHQVAIGGNHDAMLAKFSANGQLMESTYFGGADQDFITQITSGGADIVYITGGTVSTTGIATAGSFQTLNGGGADAFLARFYEDTTVYIKAAFVTDTICAGQPMQVPYGVNNPFKPGNSFTVQLSDASGSFAAPVTIGAATATLAGTINCTIPAGTPAGIGYRIRIRASSPADTSADNGFNINIKAAPPVTASSNSPVCAGATLNLNANTLAGVTYSWTGPVSYMANTQNPTRSNLTTAMAGWYVVTANNGTCTGKDSVNVTVNSVLNATIGGTGACLGGTLNLTASTTSPGATYSWNGPNSFTSNQQNPSISGVTAAAAGTYTVVITGSGCSTTLTTNVTIGTPPNAPSAGSNTPVCAGQNINLSSLSTTPGVSYSWTGPGSYTSTQQSPTRTNATVAMSGTYNVVAILNGCNSAATATNVVVNPAPAAPTASNNGPLCAGVALDLFATGQPGAGYNWTGPSYTSTAQNPTILNATTANAGTYNVTQTVGACTSLAASTTVVINNSVNPAINIFPNPNDSVCPGTPVTFVSVATNGGTTPQYQWYKNGNPIGGATNTTYNTSSFNSGDYFSCQLTSNAFCAVPATKMSNNVTLTLIPAAPAQVNITANPGLVLSPWELVTFTATSVMGGIAPSYQWYRNGQNVIGATSTTWSANNLNNLDTISVVLLSSDPCAVPNTDTSNQLIINIKTGISNLDHDNNITLYPNPNNGDFVVKGSVNAREVVVEIVNAIGQRVYSKQLPVHNAQLNEPIHIDAAAGIYLLKLKTNAQTQTLRFTLH